MQNNFALGRVLNILRWLFNGSTRITASQDLSNNRKIFDMEIERSAAKLFKVLKWRRLHISATCYLFYAWDAWPEPWASPASPHPTSRVTTHHHPPRVFPWRNLYHSGWIIRQQVKPICDVEISKLHCKKGYRFSRPHPGGHLPNSPWGRENG